MSDENIILVGFMGTGKSAIGKRLASLLHKKFYDADKEIERVTGMSLMNLYNKYGIVRFQSEEELMLRKLVKEKNAIIATGGSLVIDEERLELLMDSGVVICLTADPKVIMERVQRRNNRPLLRKDNMYQDILALIKEREDVHNKAHLVVDTSHKSFEEIIQAITTFLDNRV